MPVLEEAQNVDMNGGVINDIQGNQYNIHINFDPAPLNHAAEQFPDVEQHKAVLEALFERVKNLILELDSQRSNTPLTVMEVENVNRACERVDNAVTTLASQDLAWRLYNSEKIEAQLKEAEDAINVATTTVRLDTRIQVTALHDARESDKDAFSRILNEAARTDKAMLSALDTGGRRSRYNMVSLADAFIKLASDYPSSTLTSEQQFIRKAVNVLCRLSKHSTSAECPSWQLNELEVTYDMDDNASFLGRGGFGSVYRGEWNGVVVAVKVMNDNLAQATNQQSLKLFQQEIKTWASLSHPHILPFHGACLIASQPFIVSSFCHYGNVHKFLQEFPAFNRMLILYQVALAMAYLHGKNIIHCDLKADNVLIDRSKNAMVADFGVVSIQNQITSSATFNHKSSQQSSGTLRWMAPERFDGPPLKKSSDVYSFAITAWEVYSNGQVPFADIPDFLIPEIVGKTRKRPIQPKSLINNNLWNLICICWLPNPENRPNFITVYQELKALSSSDNKIVDLKSLLSLSKSANGQQEILNNAELLQHLVGLIATSAADTWSATTAAECLANLAVSDLGKKQLVSEPGLVKSLGNMLVTGTLEGQMQAAQCLANLAILELSKKQLLSEPGLVKSLVNMLSAAIPEGQIQAIKALSHLTMIDMGKKQLLSEPGLVKSLVNMLSTATPDGQMRSAWCLFSLAVSDIGQKQLLSESGLVKALTNMLSTATPDGQMRAAQCLSSLAILGKKQLLSEPGLVKSLVNMLSTATPEGQMRAAWCLSSLALLDIGQKQLLSESGLVKALKNMLSTAIPEGQVRAAHCLSSLAILGKKQLLSEPGLVKSLVNMLSTATPEGQMRAAWCLSSLALSDVGRTQLLSEPGLVKSLTNMLSTATPEGQVRAAWCLSNLAFSDMGQKQLLSEPGLVKSLANMLSTATPEGQIRATSCLSSLGVSDMGKKQLLSEPGLVKSLGNMLSTANSEGQMRAAWCLHNLALSGKGKALLLAEPTIVSSLKRIASNSPPDHKAVTCLQTLGIKV